MTETTLPTGWSFTVRTPGAGEDVTWVCYCPSPGEICDLCLHHGGSDDWFQCAELGGIVAHESCARALHGGDL